MRIQEVRTIIRWFTLLLAAAVLAACGGGGSDGGGFLGPDVPDPDPDSEQTYALIIESTTNPAGDSSLEFSTIEPLTVTLRLTDDGTGVAGESVSLSSTIGTVSPSNGTALTDSEGRAEFTVSATAVTGAGVLTASYGSGSAELTVELNIEAVDASVVPAYTLALATETAAGTANSAFSSSAPLTVKVTLGGISNPNGRPITLSLAGVSGAISPDNQTTLTDSSGVAEFQLRYDGQTGAGVLTATYDGPVGSVSIDSNVTAIIDPLRLGYIDDASSFIDGSIRALPSSTVGYLGAVELLMVIVDDNGDRTNTMEEVRFDSACLLNNFSSLDSGLTTTVVGGVLSVTYTAGENCAARSDTVTVTLVQPGVASPQTATIDLTVGAAPAADERFITFVSANPGNIALRGTGGGTSLEERALVAFEVRDGSGEPISGQRVDFELSTTTGGIDLADTTATTDSSGRVSVVVRAGTVPTPVRVIATTERSPSSDPDDDPSNDANALSVVSDALSISAGIPSQGRFSVAADVLNPPSAAVVNDIEVVLTALVFDRFGNPVPDGTVVNFTSECGGVGNDGPSGACQTQTGRCTATWFSQPAASSSCSQNRVGILAYVIGEETFLDADGDGYYDLGESFEANTEAYRDDNESGTFDVGEFFLDVDAGDGALNGTWDSQTPASGELFNGLACQADSSDCSSALVTVYDQVELVAGPDDAAALRTRLRDSTGTLVDPAVDAIVQGSYTLEIEDANGNMPPLGTLLSASGEGECEVVSPEVSVPNTSVATFYTFGITVRTEANQPDTDDRIQITYSIPGSSSNEVVLIYDCLPPEPEPEP